MKRGQESDDTNGAGKEICAGIVGSVVISISLGLFQIKWRWKNLNAVSMDMVEVTGAVEFKKVLDFTIKARVNEHAHMELKGIVAANSDAADLARRRLEGGEVCLQCGGEVYFTGKILRIKVVDAGGYYVMEVCCVSGSYCFDVVPHSRSFQDTKMTYGEMLKAVAKASGIGNILPIAGSGQEIGLPIIQHEETDWAFTKRMASHFGTVVIPEMTHGLPQISMGIIEGKEHVIEEQAEYEIIKNLGQQRLKRSVEPGNSARFIHYRVKEYRNFALGDKAVFLGIRLIVMAKRLWLREGLLEAEYELGFEEEYGLQKFCHRAIAGKSIEGTVLATRGEKLKIHLDIDARQDVDKAYWYTWMPQTGNLFYCMPKLGTKVNLYFADSYEGHAVATECVRTNGGARRGMRSYHLRQFLTEHEKRLSLYPGELFFAGDRAEGKNVLNLADGKGISLESEQKIFISGMKRLSLSADSRVIIQAGASLKISKNGEWSGIEFTGGEIHKYAEKIWHSGLPEKQEIGKLALLPEIFPAALFAETVAAMIPSASDAKNGDPVKLSVLGMAHMGICRLG